MQDERINLGEGNINHILWCGDFNRHHPLWDDEADEWLFTPQAIREADTLIEMIADKGLKMALPIGILTLIIQCDVDNYLQPPCTDHLPIITIIDIPQDRIEPKSSFNLRMMDWDTFRKRLILNLEVNLLPNIIENNEELQQAANDLTDSIQRTIKDQVLVSKPCLHSKR